MRVYAMMIFRTIKIFLSLFKFVDARDVNIVKVPCKYKCEELINVDGKDLELVVVTPENIQSLTCCLLINEIKNARVGGWNDHRAPMVLYDNGALAPYDEYTTPTPFCLYFMKCGCKTRIVFSCRTAEGNCKYYGMNITCYKSKVVREKVNEPCYKPCPPVYKPHPPVCPPMPRPPVCPPMPRPPVCPPVPSPPVCSTFGGSPCRDSVLGLWCV